MPTKPNCERFAQAVAADHTLLHAHVFARFSGKMGADRAGSARMCARPAIQAWVEELKADRAGIMERARALAIEHATWHIAFTREAVSAGLVKIGFAIVDMKEAKMSDKRQALMDSAKLFGRNMERREQKNVDEFADISAGEIEGWRSSW